VPFTTFSHKTNQSLHCAFSALRNCIHGHDIWFDETGMTGNMRLKQSDINMFSISTQCTTTVM